MIEKKRIEELLDRTGIPYRYFLFREGRGGPAAVYGLVSSGNE